MMRIMPACLRRLLRGTLCFCLLITLLAGCGGSAVAPPGAGSDTDTEAADTPAGTDTEETESETAVEPENRLLAGSLSDVLLTAEIPEALYEITAHNVETPSEAVQNQTAAEIADIFDCEVQWDNTLGDAADDELIVFLTDNGGEFHIHDKAVAYYSSVSAGNSLTEYKRIKTITITEDTDLTESYVLDGQDYSIGEAIDFAESFWNDTMYQYSQFDEIQVFKVLVYEWSDGRYSYVLLVDKLYEGLPIEQYSSSTLISSNDNGGFRKSSLIIEMDAPEHIIDYVDYFSFQTVSMEPLSIDIMTAEEAIARADEVLAEYTNFQVQEMKLCYAARRNFSEYSTSEEYSKGTYIYTPYWCLVLEWSEQVIGMSNYLANVSLFIDAQTGTAYLVDSIDYTELVIYE